MKIMLLIVVLSFTSLVVCKKDNNNPKKVPVTGTWHLFAVGNSFTQQRLLII